jgi:phage shock protein PspC (stress-responsive transcriptional regulator)
MPNIETDSTMLPPPYPPTALPRRHRWARSDDRVIFGVAGGLGQALAIEPLVVRIVFVVLALFSGVGIVVYLAAMLLLADSPSAEPPSASRRVAGSAALALSAYWVFNGDAMLPSAGWVVALGLMGIAVALWRGRTAADGGSPYLSPASPEPDTADSGGSTTDRWSALTDTRARPPKPPRSALGMLSIGAATVIGAAVWLANGNSTNRGAHAFGTAAVVLGAGLLIGAFAGRARWLFLPAVASIAAAVVASALSFANAGITDSGGNTVAYVAPGQQVGSDYRTGIGDFQLWLNDYPSDAATTISVGIGHLLVVVPDDARVQVDAKVGIGDIDVFGNTRNGYRRHFDFDSNTGKRMIKLTLRTGVGGIEVRRASAGAAFIPLDGVVPTTLGLYLTVPVSPVAQSFNDGTVVYADGTIDFGNGQVIAPDGTNQMVIVAQLPDGSLQFDNGAILHADGSAVTPGGFVIAARQPAAGPVTVLPQPVLPAIPTITQQVQP